jgi:hypothetical protein
LAGNPLNTLNFREIVLASMVDAIRMVQSGILSWPGAPFLWRLPDSHGMGYSSDALDKLLKL